MKLVLLLLLVALKQIVLGNGSESTRVATEIEDDERVSSATPIESNLEILRCRRVN